MTDVPDANPQAPPIHLFGRSPEEWVHLFKVSAVVLLVVVLIGFVFWFWIRPWLRHRWLGRGQGRRARLADTYDYALLAGPGVDEVTRGLGVDQVDAAASDGDGEPGRGGGHDPHRASGE
jgi:hypothetical protein